MDKLVASSIVANSAAMLAAGEYTTKAEYLSNAEELRDLLDDFQEWSDEGYDAIESSEVDMTLTDTGYGCLVGAHHKFIRFENGDEGTIGQRQDST